MPIRALRAQNHCNTQNETKKKCKRLKEEEEKKIIRNGQKKKEEIFQMEQNGLL